MTRRRRCTTCSAVLAWDEPGPHCRRCVGQDRPGWTKAAGGYRRGADPDADPDSDTSGDIPDDVFRNLEDGGG